jgi:uncharacterized glyoxalase superfamily protein PhnB
MMGTIGKDGKLDFCIVTREGAMIMLGRPQEKRAGTAPMPRDQRALDIYVEVADVDAYHAELRKRRVAVSAELTTQWWGDRNFGVDDPYGYRLWFYTTVLPFDKVSPPDGVKMV